MFSFSPVPQKKHSPGRRGVRNSHPPPPGNGSQDKHSPVRTTGRWTPRSRSRKKPGRTETAARDRLPTGAGCPGGSARERGVELRVIRRMSHFSPQVGHVRNREGGRSNRVTQGFPPVARRCPTERGQWTPEGQNGCLGRTGSGLRPAPAPAPCRGFPCACCSSTAFFLRARYSEAARQEVSLRLGHYRYIRWKGVIPGSRRDPGNGVTSGFFPRAPRLSFVGCRKTP